MTRLRPVGDDAVLIECADSDSAVGLAEALQRADRESLLQDVVPAARTVLAVARPGSGTRLSALISVAQSAPQPELRVGALVEVPTIYDGADLTPTAQALELEVDELVAQHAAASWRVAFIGFAPGFAYLEATSWSHDVPRLATPRTRVPPGAVALAGSWSAVYTRATPGGWRLLGRTERRLWDLDRQPPTLLTAGTRVRFVPA